MDLEKYCSNLENQIKDVKYDIMVKEEELSKLKEFSSRLIGGLEVLTQLRKENPAQTLKKEIQQTVEELSQDTTTAPMDPLY
jgi:predicted RNase H-like nuclease (RuvC/YqgF family)